MGSVKECDGESDKYKQKRKQVHVRWIDSENDADVII